MIQRNPGSAPRQLNVILNWFDGASPPLTDGLTRIAVLAALPFIIWSTPQPNQDGRSSLSVLFNRSCRKCRPHVLQAHAPIQRPERPHRAHNG